MKLSQKIKETTASEFARLHRHLARALSEYQDAPDLKAIELHVGNLERLTTGDIVFVPCELCASLDEVDGDRPKCGWTGPRIWQCVSGCKQHGSP